MLSHLFPYVVAFLVFNVVASEEEAKAGGCFCKLEGKIDDCTCSVDTVDHFNNAKIYPRLKSILVKDYFRYIKVDLNRGCPFWADDSRCALKDCSVQTCPEEQLPPGLKGQASRHTLDEPVHGGEKYTQGAQEEDSCDDNYGGLGAVNETISDEHYEEFQKWQKHDDSVDKFCEIDDEMSSELQYIDLLLNPERYTGYKGFSAQRIWKSIYEENCFNTFGGDYGPYTTSKNLNALCLEKRTFYRALSGLHASISIHLCSQYYVKAKNGFGKGDWGINIQEFKKRFDPSTTNGEGAQWLKNLYFLYLLELRAIAKVAAYLENESFYTGNADSDAEVKAAVMDILKIAKSFAEHFNESVMFSGDDSETKKMKEEFRQHFHNISIIMNCVGCDKCRLWGKIQVQGLGTAFKILFSGESGTPFSLPQMKKKKFQLSRAEIVSLFNAFGRLSNSIYQLENFRKLLKEDNSL